MINDKLEIVDREIKEAIDLEYNRQRQKIELIASENFTSKAVMEAMGSILTNKYAEGYPERRYYGGCEYVDIVENIAIDRAKKLFNAEHANVQPHCGSSTNMAVYFAFLKPGDRILTMDLSHGGHLTHGNKANFSGRFFEVKHYGVTHDTETIDYNELVNMLNIFLSKLSIDKRRIFLERYWYLYSIKDIASKNKLSVNNTKVILSIKPINAVATTLLSGSLFKLLKV